MEHEEIQNSTDQVLEMNKRKRDLKVELALFFVLGFLIGITFKTEALKRITMGFEDYKIKAAKESYDVTAIKRKLIEESEQAKMDAEQALPETPEDGQEEQAQ